MDSYLSITLMKAMSILIILIAVAIYFAPTLIAFKRSHPNKVWVLLLNVLLGWTCFGWATALVWSFIDKDLTELIQSGITSGRSTRYADIEKLSELKNNGAITEEEFLSEKNKLLNQ